MAQQRYWLLTIPENDFNSTNYQLKGNCIYLKGQKEIGANTGFRHWQLLAIFKRAVRRSAVTTIFGQSCHAEPSRSSAANEYVWKEDTRIPDTQFEIGELPFNRNSKTDWAAAKEKAKAGLIDEVPADVYIKYYNTLKAIARDNMGKPDDLTSPTGVWIYGPPGVGKSHFARDAYPDYYSKPQSKWWDGYQGEKNVILDDFDSKQLGHLLKIWADQYSFIAESKGHAARIRPDRFVITSNYSIEQIFGEDQVLCAAIKRRFYVINIPMRRY